MRAIRRLRKRLRSPDGDGVLPDGEDEGGLLEADIEGHGALRDVLEEAAAFFERQLWGSPGAAARCVWTR